MRHSLLTGGIAVCALSTCLSAQRLDDAAVDAAIKAGQNKKHGSLYSSCVATAGFGDNMAAAMAGGVQPTGSFDVIVSRGAGRIAYMAAEAKRLYKSFTAADIPEPLRANNTVHVVVEPRSPHRSNNTIDVAPPIERVVLKSKANDAVVAQPQHVELTPVEWKNLLGGYVQGTSAIATFAVNDVSEFPPGDFDVVLITQAGERRCKVGKSDRQRLFGQ